jgi:membrane fusion protein, hemolysin D
MTRSLQSSGANDAAAKRSQFRVVAPAKLSVVAEFQSDAIEVEERLPPRIARITLYCVVALIIAGVSWASLSSVDSIVTAQGKLITTSSNVVVQPLETSVIREIHVKVGDFVHQGQALATLDPTFSQADVDQLRTRFAALEAASKRLYAELNGLEFAATDPTNPDDDLQERLFNQRRAFYKTTLHNYDAQIAGARANLQTSHDEEGVLVQRLETMNAIETMRRMLADKELGSRLNLLLSRDARLEVEHNLSRVRGNQENLVHQVEKVQAEQQVFIEDFRRTAYQELVDTLAKRNSAAEDLKKAERRRQLIVLTAPVDSVVLEVASRSVGSVVREAETLFALVPHGVPLQAEINVDSKDIGQVAFGQEVRLKFDAFPFQKHGTASGTVQIISQDSFTPDAKGEAARHSMSPYYRVLVAMPDPQLRGLPEQFRMIPGMTVTAEMKVRHRTVISYFLYPLLRGLDESIREP